MSNQVYEQNFDINNLDPNDFVLINKGEAIKDEVSSVKALGFFKDAWVRLKRNKSAMMAFTLIIIIAFFAVTGPSMNKWGYNDQNPNWANLPPRIPGLASLGIADGTRILENRRTDYFSDPNKYPEGSIISYTVTGTVNGIDMADTKVDAYKLAKVPDDVNFLFGTDYLGRDLWTRMWRGARVSLTIAILAVSANIIIGVVYGAISGYYGGSVDMVLMRITEILGAFPQTIVATMLVLILGRGIKGIVCAMLIRGWTGTARLIRAQFFRYKGREYVLAARSLGVPDRKLIFRHILPNSIGPLITQAMVSIPGAIFSESFLSFIGLGLQAPEPSIGVLLSDAQKTLLTYPYQMVFPAILISILMISFNLLGNGLRDAFDPTMRGVTD